MTTRTRERLIGLVTGVIVTLIALALIEVVGAQQTEAQTKLVCVPEDARDRIRDILIDGLDEALKLRIEHVFEVWMKDERGQPERAAEGMRQAVNAYVRSRKAMHEWNPQACP